MSNVNLVGEQEGGIESHSLGACHSVTELVDSLGEKVEVKASVRQASKSGKHKCPRCWKWTSPAEGGLCSRCDVVLNS